MSGEVDKFKIGLFVVGSLILTVAFLIWLGASRYFEDTRPVVAYFNESVQGLESDSHVKFRGVPVGRVRAIKMAPDGRLVEVLINLEKNFKLTDELGIKMNLVGLTGMKYLEIDQFRPEQRKEPVDLTFVPKYPVLKTYPSDIKEIGAALENVFQKVNAVDVARISTNLVNLTSKMDKMLSELRPGRLSYEASLTLREMRLASRRINDEITKVQLSKNLNRTLQKANEFFQEGTETAKTAEKMISRTDHNINQLSQKFDRTADNLIGLTNTIRNKPSLLFYGSEEKKK
jgi:ABC-type transporter Mla subunit MlaD